MCIKIVCPEKEFEFDMAKPLDEQIFDAKQVIVKYEEKDPKIDCFLVQIEHMVKNGISCNAEITVNPNNFLAGYRLERKLETLKKKLDVNQVIRGVCHLAIDTDKKLEELSNMCLRKADEQ